LGERTKLHGIDLARILTPSASIRPGAAVRNVTKQDHGWGRAEVAQEVLQPSVGVTGPGRYGVTGAMAKA
jgi:hypothetical protein